jgi:hypothetical protein
MLMVGCQTDFSFKSFNLMNRTKELDTESNVYSGDSETDKNFGEIEYLIRSTL